MENSVKATVLISVSIFIAATFLYLGSILPYPDGFIIAFIGVVFAMIFSLVLYVNTGTADY